jgi:TM2 domain-containing membrane protein YozV
MSSAGPKGPDEKYCQDCGAVIRAKAEICPKCGVRQISPQPPAGMIAPNGKSKTAAGLFAVLLGGFGIHKFYLGQPGWGLIYLLFCWTLIPAIVGLIEGIVLLTMSDAVFVEKYGGIKGNSQVPADSRFASKEEYELWRRGQGK